MILLYIILLGCTFKPNIVFKQPKRAFSLASSKQSSLSNLRHDFIYQHPLLTKPNKVHRPCMKLHEIAIKRSINNQLALLTQSVAG